MPFRRAFVVALISLCLLAGLPAGHSHITAFAQASIQAPEQFLGFHVGEDKKLARWDKILEYLRLVDNASDRVILRELGKTTMGNSFVVVEISASETLKDQGRFKELQRKLYFQGGPPSESEREEIFRSGKAVVLVTCNIHSTEIGSSQMALELVHRLATEDSPLVKKILDNVIFLLVPSLNPDGQILVTDWYNKNLGTEFENSTMPWLYHPYVGHDNNRDMYMFTQRESQLTAQLLWHDWLPAVWLDEHQMGSQGARIFVMPATDPINPNVHPLVYRWNGILGQAQAAALEAAGKEGIIYNSTYTNFWQGAMAWSGWWHNQVGLLTEVASVRVASPIEQQRAQPGRSGEAPAEDFQRQMRRQMENPNAPLAPPRDVQPRTEYPRPWLGGRWTLRDIVDYELIATMALLETAAAQREPLLRQVYEMNRATVTAGGKGDPAAILVDAEMQHDPLAAIQLIDKLRMGGVGVYRAESDFETDGRKHPAGTFVIPMNQVFARYAKDLLEKQTYPEVRRTPTAPPEPPYDVTAWSLGMQMGVETLFSGQPVPETAHLSRLEGAPRRKGQVSGTGLEFVFDYRGADAARAINRLLKQGAMVQWSREMTDPSAAIGIRFSGISQAAAEALAEDIGLSVRALENTPLTGRKTSRLPAGGQTKAADTRTYMVQKSPRIGFYQPWTASMDEGWTRWVLEQYEFPYTSLHNDAFRAGKLREKHDVILLADQQPQSILEGNSFRTVRPEYRGGIGAEGVQALREFVRQGGTLVALGASCDLIIDKFPIAVRNLKRGLNRDQHFAPGTILRLQVDTTHSVGFGMPAETYGFYNNSPFFTLVEGFASQKASVVARYPNADLVASGWLRGEEHMAGRAAVVSVEMNPGRIVLFGLRPQHRAQTHATFPLLFNALFMASRN